MCYLVQSSVEGSFKNKPDWIVPEEKFKVFLLRLRLQARNTIKGEFGSWRGENWYL